MLLDKIAVSDIAPANTGVIWIKPVGDNYEQYIFLNGKWVKLDKEEEISGIVSSVNNQTPDSNGNVNLTKEHIGLEKVDNTSDTEKVVKGANEDGSGNNIATTYETKSDATSKQTAINTTISELQAQVAQLSGVENAFFGGIVGASTDIATDYTNNGYSGTYLYMVGTDMSSLVAYQYSGSGSPTQLFSGTTYDFTDYSEVKQKVAALGQEISQIESTLYGEKEIGYDSVVSTAGYWTAAPVAVGSVYSGTYQDFNGEWRRWPVQTIKAGQTLTLICKGGTNARAFCITDASTNIVIAKAASGADYTETPYTYTATVDSLLYANTSKNYEGSIVIRDEKDLSEKFESLAEDVEGLMQNVPSIKSDVEELKGEISVTEEELNAINDLTPYVIATNGTLESSLSGYHVKMIEVSEGDYIHVTAKRTDTSGNTRLSGAFYSTSDDDTTYTLISIVGFSNWTKNSNSTVDYYVTVPSGANRIAIAGGATTSNIEYLKAIKIEYSDLNILKQHTQQILALLDIPNINSPVIFNPSVDLRRSTLKVLSIGNSFTVDATAYLPSFITAAGVDVSDMCIYTMTRSSGSWYTFVKSWRGQDGQSGNTSQYAYSKVCGELTPTYDYTDSLTRMHSVLKDIDWDLIVLHQVSDYAADFNNWEGDTSAGYLKEAVRILRTYQPNAAIGMLMTHASHQQSPAGTSTRWQGIADSVKFMQSRYGIDFVVPVATAIENIRASSLNTSSHGLSRDNHHLGYGLARYVAAATYFQMLICGRYGGSVVGNTCVHTVTTSEHNDVGESYQGDLIDVTAENRQVAQIAAALACSDMFSIVNPDDVEV